MCTYFCIYIFGPRGRVLPEEQIIAWLVNRCPSFHRPQRFIADIEKPAIGLTDIFISLPISSWFGDPRNTSKLLIMLFSPTTIVIVCRDTAVGIATGYRLDDRGVRVRVLVGSRIFYSPCRPDRLWGTLRPGILSPEVKRSWSEADHSPPTSAEVKKIWTHISTPPYAFMA
jgi:hypothetical protein